MWLEQAIFTSILRQGRGGYHLVSRSRGVSDADAQAISRWSPSHGSLLLDPINLVSISFYPLPSGRFALARSCEGPPEYSGRGGRQLYTHVMVLDDKALLAVNAQPFAIYYNALALGHLFYQLNPPSTPQPLELPNFHLPLRPDEWLERAAELQLPELEPHRARLLSGRPVRLPHVGDRAALAECLVGTLPPEAVRKLSFATSLQPSSVRPFMLTLVDGPPARN